MVPEFQVPQVRERISGEYRLMYRLIPEGIEILTIVHGARNLGPD
jgi:plasmid stabilization system protein ParE